MIEKRRPWSRRTRIGRANICGVAQLQEEDEESITWGLALMLGLTYGRERMPVVSDLSLQECKWLSRVVAWWAGVPFDPSPDQRWSASAAGGGKERPDHPIGTN